MSGYTGFGMKEENYTRRPKKAFENYKENFVLKSIRSGSRLDRNSYGIYSGNWTSSGEKKIFKIVKQTLVVASLAVLLFVFILDPIYFRIRKDDFEKVYFFKLYESNRVIFDNLQDLYESLSMVHLFKITDYGSVFTVIKSSDFDYKGTHHGGDNVVNLTSSLNRNYLEFTIEQGTLFVNRIDKKYHVSNNWAVIYAGALTDTLTVDKVLPLVNLDRPRVVDCLSDLSEIDVEEFYLDETKTVHLKLKENKFGRYEIVISQKPIQRSRNSSSGRLSAGIYWIETK